MLALGQPHRSFQPALAGMPSQVQAVTPGVRRRGAYVGLSWKPILNKPGQGRLCHPPLFPRGRWRLAARSCTAEKPSACVALRSPQASLFWCHALGSAWYQNSAQYKEDIDSSCLLFQGQPSSYKPCRALSLEDPNETFCIIPEARVVSTDSGALLGVFGPLSLVLHLCIALL